MIRMMSDTVGGLIKGTGDGIASAMGSSEPKGGDKTSSSDVPDIDTPKVPDVSKTSDDGSHSSHKKGGGRTKKRKKHKKRKSRKRPKGARADRTPDATNYTGGYADNISAYELRQLRLRNERLERERQAEIERERLIIKTSPVCKYQTNNKSYN